MAGALAATLVAAPVVQASRERTRLAALAEVPGVVRPLRSDLHALFCVAADAGLLWRSDLRAVVLPSGKGNLARVWAALSLGRVVASRADVSAAVLG